ncbi:MAG: hypothetical protein ABI877_11770 [Gemmatimonadaceae bacterium]
MTAPVFFRAARRLSGRQRYIVASIALIGAACAHFPREQSGLRVIPMGASVAPTTPERSSFEVMLVATDGNEGTPAGKATGSTSISVRGDNSLEYEVEIDNVGGETFTQAQVVRVVAADSTVDVIATLFSDVMMRDHRISVRGTASLARSLPPDALLAHVREHPSEYRVIVRSERHPVGSLTGSLGSSP